MSKEWGSEVKSTQKGGAIHLTLPDTVFCQLPSLPSIPSILTYVLLHPPFCCRFVCENGNEKEWMIGCSGEDEKGGEGLKTPCSSPISSISNYSLCAKRPVFFVCKYIILTVSIFPHILRTEKGVSLHNKIVRTRDLL